MTMGVLLCMLLICAWPVQLTVPASLAVRVGMPLADVYLEFLAGRSRHNTVLAAGYDIKVFFSVVSKATGRCRAC